MVINRAHKRAIKTMVLLIGIPTAIYWLFGPVGVAAVVVAIGGVLVVTACYLLVYCAVN